MKKTSNTIGYLAAFAVALTVAFKLNHIQGTNIIMFIAGILLSIYFPLFILDRMRDSADDKTLPLHIVAALSALLVTLFFVFRLEQWPGAAILVLLGLACFSLLFVPMLFVQKSKQQGANNVMNFIGALGLATLPLGMLFKIQHWAGAQVLLFASPALLFLIYFPMYMMNSSVNAEKRNSYLRDAFFIIIIGIILVVSEFRVVYSAENETNNTTNSGNETSPADNLKIESYYAGMKYGKITRKEFLSDSIIHTDNENVPNPSKHQIISFKISITQEGKDAILDIPSDGNKVPEKVRSLIKDLPTGSRIFFEYINEKTDNGVRHLEPMAFTIADE